MRWKVLVAGVALALAASLGCKQQIFLTQADYNHFRDVGLPANLEDPGLTLVPASSTAPAPATILNPDREPRYLTLAEATASALENGTIGSPALNGTTNTSLASFAGRAVFFPENNIRALTYDPAIVGSDIEASLAKFDVRWDTSMTWTTTDKPVATALDVFQAQALNNIATNDATFNTSLLKPLPTGGVAGITFSTAYEFTNLPARVNPSYRPTLQFQFEQPLLQGFGVEINQLRASHPGSVLTPFQAGGRVEGIVIARLRFDQQRAEFERNLDIMLVNVEVAYWNLYGSYWNLYSREQAMRQAFEAWKINKEKFEAGRIPVQDFAQVRGQYESFRAQRIQALGQVLENERALRSLMGIPIEDGTRLIPVDTPTVAPYMPDWNTAVNEALALRPELTLVRQDIKFRQLDLINQKNLTLPDLRVGATYDLNSVGTRLDGGPNDPNNAFSNLAKNNFNDWSIFIRMDVALGYRDANAAVRAAKLNLARSYAIMQDQEQKAQQFLALEYTNVIEFYETIRANRAQREAAAITLDARFKEFLAGKGTLDFLLESQRVWADALRDEYTSIVQYNNALATYEYAKGTLLQHDNITIAEGALPHAVQQRAVEHEREKAKAIVLRERAQPVVHPKIETPGGPLTGAPDVSAPTPPSVPSLLEGAGNASTLPDRLPDLKKPDLADLPAGVSLAPPALRVPTIDTAVKAPRASTTGAASPLSPYSPVPPREQKLLPVIPTSSPTADDPAEKWAPAPEKK
jgi:outer membrane protein TolC